MFASDRLLGLDFGDWSIVATGLAVFGLLLTLF